MRRFFVFVVAGLWACAFLSACSGVPLSSVPRLLALRTELLVANPAEIMLAVQTDERLVPARGGVPTLDFDVRPEEPGTFEAVQRSVPMRLKAGGALPPGLPGAGAGRHWMIYDFGPEAQKEVASLQARIKQIRADRQGKTGGSLGIAVTQDGLAPSDSRLGRTLWQSWLQTSAKTGF
ncbi:MAG: hypothetical protein V4636_02635, partial [Pseudomonadota bacterium]